MESFDDKVQAIFKITAIIVRSRKEFLCSEESQMLQEWLNASKMNAQWYREFMAVKYPEEYLNPVKEFHRSSRKELAKICMNAGICMNTGLAPKKRQRVMADMPAAVAFMLLFYILRMKFLFTIVSVRR